MTKSIWRAIKIALLLLLLGGAGACGQKGDLYMLTENYGFCELMSASV